MKNITTLLLLSTVFLSSCSKSDKAEPIVQNKKDTTENMVPGLKIDKELKPLVWEFTSTGCPGCGSWGKPTFKAVLDQNMGDAIGLAVHIKYGDPMITSYSTEIGANRYGQFYTPQIWVNDSNGVVLNGGSINGMASVERLNKLIDFHKQNRSNILTDIQFVKNNNKVSFRYGIKGSTSEDSLYVSCFLIENDVVATQSSYANNPAKHPFVIREAAAGTYGQKTFLSADNDFISEFESEFELKTTNGKYDLTVVVWEKVNNRYKSIGGYSVTL